MTDPKDRSRTVVRSREHLLHLLAEAAELEHNLLCSYLYSAFSLKQGPSEDLLPHEWEAVERWRGAIMSVCVEEMVHLAQVANLMMAVGSKPHFDRPNLPVAPGYHPADIQIALTPFDLDTLDHFIYLERPDGSNIGDAEGFAPKGVLRRDAEVGRLMPSAPGYRTIGDFYELLEGGLEHLTEVLGEAALFLGPADYQLRADEIKVPELSVVTDLASACRAIHLIVVQGEGSVESNEESHFAKFVRTRDEYRRLREARPEFTPIRPVARNPTMRRPLVVADRVHITGTASAPVLDAANAVYSLMLRCLVELYETSSAAAERRNALLGAAFGLMRVLGELASALSALAATDADDSVNAGVTFAMLRSTEGLAPGVDPVVILSRRFADIEARLSELALPDRTGTRLAGGLARLRGDLHRASDSDPVTA